MQRIQLASQTHLLRDELGSQGPGRAQLSQAAADDDSLQASTVEHAFGRPEQAAGVAGRRAEVGQSGGVVQRSGHRIASGQEDQH